MSQTPTYDAIVVGSGAGGGIAAFILATSGLRVLMLEAGRDYDPLRETPMFQLPKDAPLRGAGTSEKPFGFYDATVDGGWQVPGEPYSVADGSEFMWWRSRMLGGRTNHWGRISLRMGEYDFKPRSRDGPGLRLADVVRGPGALLRQDRVADRGVRLERGAGEHAELVAGRVAAASEAARVRAADPEGLPTHGDSGHPRASGHHDADAGPQPPSRRIFPNNDLARRVTADSMRGRAACYWATPCGRGCSIRANFQSTTVLLPPALATGNLEVRTGAMVREVTVDARGRATGVHYIDKATLLDEFAAARVVVLAASACESARILLNSTSNQFPDGLANSSGLVGKYLMDTVGAGVYSHIPALQSLPPHNEDGASAMHMYMPWWLYGEQLAGQLDFPRGYHIEFGGGRRMPGFGAFSGLEPLTRGSYGQRFKDDCRRYYGSFVGFDGRGEMIPNEDCYCEIDPDNVDRYGIPVLKFHWKWADHELNQALHMQRTFAEIVDEMGGTLLSTVQTDGARAISKGGQIIHEVGGAIMGDDRRTSVLNQYCQSWDVPNLFVTDGAPFVSNADKNPTLSIMAIAWRASDYIVEQLGQRSIG